MTNKHTPGPWVACGSEDSLATWVEDCYGKRVCTIRQCEADWKRAQLIASAPDLLAERDRLRQVNAELVAALRDLLNCYRDETGTTGGRDGPDQREEVINARAAISKAKGE